MNSAIQLVSIEKHNSVLKLIMNDHKSKNALSNKMIFALKNMANFSEINSIYGRYFNEDTAPARETVEVANLPKYVNVEISMIAVK